MKTKSSSSSSTVSESVSSSSKPKTPSSASSSTKSSTPNQPRISNAGGRSPARKRNSSTVTNPNVFHVDDFNFTGYDLPRLVFMSEHRLVLRTRFPKLVVTLFHHPQFAEWMQPHRTSSGAPRIEHVLVDRLVECVNRYCSDPQGRLRHSTVTLDNTLCTQMIELITGGDTSSHLPTPSTHQTTSLPETVRAHHENAVTHKVDDTLLNPSDSTPTSSTPSTTSYPHHKTVKNITTWHTWKDCSLPRLELDVKAPTSTHRRTRKRPPYTHALTHPNSSETESNEQTAGGPTSTPFHTYPTDSSPDSPDSPDTVASTKAPAPTWSEHQTRTIQIC